MRDLEEANNTYFLLSTKFVPVQTSSALTVCISNTIQYNTILYLPTLELGVIKTCVKRKTLKRKEITLKLPFLNLSTNLLL